jgi:hypothetical protein
LETLGDDGVAKDLYELQCALDVVISHVYKKTVKTGVDSHLWTMFYENQKDVEVAM